MRSLLTTCAALALSFAALGARAEETAPPKKVVLFFGDSLTAGYGVGREAAFPARLQGKVDSLGWNFEMVNAGLSGETTAAGLRRIDWLLRRRVDLFVLELGANDGLRGIDLAETERNLRAILDRVHARYPKAELVLAGMKIPPNLGPRYTEAFAEIYPRLAADYEAALIPFLLEGVAAVPELNRGIHPTEKGHVIVAETVWKTLRPVLEKLRQDATQPASRKTSSGGDE